MFSDVERNEFYRTTPNGKPACERLAAGRCWKIRQIVRYVHQVAKQILALDWSVYAFQAKDTKIQRN
jgi:hypothetical protein